jgi:hypothetical protein
MDILQARRNELTAAWRNRPDVEQATPEEIAQRLAQTEARAIDSLPLAPVRPIFILR